MVQTATRRKKSVSLDRAEFTRLKKWVAAQPTKLDACAALCISRPTLDRVLLAGSGSPETIQTIKAILNA